MDFSIDPLRLDRECLKQANAYFDVAKDLAEARRTYDALQSELQVLKADLDLAIRKDPAKYDLDKVTESTVASAVTVAKEVVELNQEIRAARYEMDVLTGALEAMQHRKRALEKLVDLHLSNYYSEPQLTKEGREAVDDANKTSLRRRVGVRKK